MATTAETLAPVPAHVPPGLVHDFDFLAPSVPGDLYQWWDRVHEAPPIFWTQRHGGHWVTTRHADIAHVLETYDTFSSQQMTVPRGTHSFPSPPIMYDPPLHTDFRKLLAPFFTPKSIGNLELKARALSVALIEGFAATGECEFVSQFALAMPIGIFLSLVDLPDTDRLELLGCAEKMVRGHTPEEQTEGFMQAYAYLGRVFAARRENPGDDILSSIMQGTVEDGRPLTEMELLGMGALLLAGGLDTVAGMMGFIMIHLAEHDDQRRQLAAQQELIPMAVEELMRRFQIANVARLVVRDTELGGVAMKAGDMVLTPTSMAGIDPERYPDSMTVDFARADKRSLVFGKGAHQCIGAFLARTELRVFLAEWLGRIPEFRIAPGQRPVTVPGRANAVHSLPLVWDIAR
ncbi:cytochrome P450 [Novosphingobium lentum]|uniref:cytochrome P450 n=1 Tax=Novosphingobium lentum TaxID=145287 RepID=UPI00082B4F14|nr:cytochrome P450 [Novosphingobium lentum]